jgi:hypothetical protein
MNGQWRRSVGPNSRQLVSPGELKMLGFMPA